MYMICALRKGRNVVEQKPIKCPNPDCEKVVVSDEANLRHLLLTDDIKCPHCGTVTVKAPPKVTY